MESLFKLPMASGARVRILQITDTHLFAGEHETLLGVNTSRSYRAVLDAIIAEQHPFDLIVATGDLAQDHSVAPLPLIKILLRVSPVCQRPVSGFLVIMISNRLWWTP